jgi:hypothetical protein
MSCPDIMGTLDCWKLSMNIIEKWKKKTTTHLRAEIITVVDLIYYFFLLVLHAQLGQVSHSFKFKSYCCFHNWKSIRQYRFCTQTYCTLAYNCIGFIQLNVIFRFFDWIMWALWFSVCIARKALALLTLFATVTKHSGLLVSVQNVYSA